MRDGELGHVVVLVAERDKVVVDARLVLVRVVKVEELGLDVVGRQLLRLKLGQLLEEALLVRGRHAPDDDDAVVEQKDLGHVHRDVELGHAVVDDGEVVVVVLLRRRAVAVDRVRQADEVVGVVARRVAAVEELARRVAALVLGDEARVGFGLPLARLLGLLRAVAVGRVDALVDELGVGAAGAAAPLEEAHQVVGLVSVGGAVSRDAREAVAIGLAQAGGIPAGCWVLDARVLRVDIAAALLVFVLLGLGVWQKLELLCVLGAPLGADLWLMGEQKATGCTWALYGVGRAVAVAAAELVVEGREHLRTTSQAAGADG